MNRVLPASTPCSIVCLDGFSEAFYTLLVATARATSSQSSDDKQAICDWKKFVTKQLIVPAAFSDALPSSAPKATDAAKTTKATKSTNPPENTGNHPQVAALPESGCIPQSLPPPCKITFPVTFSDEVLKVLQRKLLDLGQQAIYQAVSRCAHKDSHPEASPLPSHNAPENGQMTAFTHEMPPSSAPIGLFATLPLIDYDENQLTCIPLSIMALLFPENSSQSRNSQLATSSSTPPYTIAELSLFNGNPLFVQGMTNLEEHCTQRPFATASLRAWYQLLSRIQRLGAGAGNSSPDTSVRPVSVTSLHAKRPFIHASTTHSSTNHSSAHHSSAKHASTEHTSTLSLAILWGVYRQLAEHYGGCRYDGRLGAVLKPVSVAKPWGREIWYTGIEKRGVSLMSGLSHHGTLQGTMPLSQVLHASYLLKPLVSFAMQKPEKDPILLKVLDPLPDTDYGDLYYELHQKKCEVYAISHIHPQAHFPALSSPILAKAQESSVAAPFTDQAAKQSSSYPEAVTASQDQLSTHAQTQSLEKSHEEATSSQHLGAIRLGFDVEKRAKYPTFAAFKADFKAAIAAYRSVRLVIDKHLDVKRLEQGLALHAEVAPARLKKWMETIPLAVRKEEQTKRAAMESFSALIPLAVGDTVTIPPGVPHSLQHGVRAVEFQTPFYERLIISFIQKTLTQDHWDTDAAFQLLDEVYIEEMTEKVRRSVKMSSQGPLSTPSSPVSSTSLHHTLEEHFSENSHSVPNALNSPKIPEDKKNSLQRDLLTHSNASRTHTRLPSKGSRQKKPLYEYSTVIADFPDFSVYKTILAPKVETIELCEEDYILLYVLKGEIRLIFDHREIDHREVANRGYDDCSNSAKNGFNTPSAHSAKRALSKRISARRKNASDHYTFNAMGLDKAMIVYELAQEEAFCVFRGARKVMIENSCFQSESIYLKAIPK